MQKLPYTCYHLDHTEDDDHLDHDELMTIKFVRKLEAVHEEVGGCIQGSWRLYTRKLEVVHKEIGVVHKEVGGCLISYNLQLACVAKLEVI